MDEELQVLIENRSKAVVRQDFVGSYWHFDRELVNTLLPRRFGGIESADLYKEDGSENKLPKWNMWPWDYELFAIRKVGGGE